MDSHTVEHSSRIKKNVTLSQIKMQMYLKCIFTNERHLHGYFSDCKGLEEAEGWIEVLYKEFLNSETTLHEM